jgi:erythronate-4-phosphate dehydrogenase
MVKQPAIRVAADQYLVDLEDFTDDQVELITYDPSEENWSAINEFDALLIRTVHPVDHQAIQHFPPNLSFVATGSAGYDHVDRKALKDHNITFAHAPGCNAQAVAEYVLTAIIIWATQQHRPLDQLSLGIVGMGNVGQAVEQLANQLGISTRGYDPPREQREPSFNSVSLKKVLDTDILTLHTPLTTPEESDYPTHHWFNEKRIGQQKFALIINAARGGIVNEAYLDQKMERQEVKNAILDVWENEPHFDCQRAASLLYSTPHIAGYSLESKRRATQMICHALYHHFGLDPVDTPIQTTREYVHFDSNEPLISMLHQVHPIKNYDHALRDLCQQPDTRAQGFARLRTGMPLRHEYQFMTLDPEILNQYPVLKQLGIQPNTK